MSDFDIFNMHPRDNPVGYRNMILIVDPSRQDHEAMARYKIATCPDLDDVLIELPKLTLPCSVGEFVVRFQRERAAGRWIGRYSERLTQRQCQMGGFRYARIGGGSSI